MNKLKAIDTFYIKDTEFDEENDGIIVIKVFNKKKIGIGVSVRVGADAELWLSPGEAQRTIKALQIAVEEVSKADDFPGELEL